tara:strand:+ start:751 stop:945 length:195 start_codon:yes stop_codon:yes gene_type:complete
MVQIMAQPSFVCHKKQHLQCAGHMLMNGQNNEFVRLAGRLRIKLDLSGEDVVFDTKAECIEHHE